MKKSQLQKIISESLLVKFLHISIKVRRTKLSFRTSYWSYLQVKLCKSVTKHRIAHL